MIGKITLFPYDFEPNGWINCDGRLIPTSENETLFTLLGTTFGGDGENTFAVPDLTRITPPNCRYCMTVKGAFNEDFYPGIVGETFLSVASPSARNLMECTGQTLTKQQAPLLLMFMGSRFGGDGVKNFNLPDLRGKAPAGLRYSIAVQGNDPNFPREPYLGELFLLPYEASTENLMLCNGNRMSTSQSNGTLFSLLGMRFGGDAQQFALPDLRAAAPPNYSYYMSGRGVMPPRA